ncbi:MAG: hypothetical protein Q8P31_04285 [Bacillota bacterium]|nr:hypothetical protein [Bacillota bacterium]
MTSDIGIWVAAICTLAMFSFLWKENSIFRSFQHIYVGIAAGYGMVRQWQAINNMAITPLLTKGVTTWIVPIILGVLLFARFFKSIAYLSRWSVAFLIGIGGALSIKILETEFIRQAQATFVPMNSFNNIVLVLGTVAGLCYFYFTIKPSTALLGVAKLGRYVLMISFGAGFGNAVMGRVSLLISRMQFLFGQWIYLIKM